MYFDKERHVFEGFSVPDFVDIGSARKTEIV